MTDLEREKILEALNYKDENGEERKSNNDLWEDKLTKISEILDKYGFKLSNTKICNNPKNKVLQEMVHTNLDEIADALTDFGNCIIEIMRVIYNVKKLDE